MVTKGLNNVVAALWPKNEGIVVVPLKQIPVSLSIISMAWLTVCGTCFFKELL